MIRSRTNQTEKEVHPITKEVYGNEPWPERKASQSRATGTVGKGGVASRLAKLLLLALLPFLALLPDGVGIQAAPGGTVPDIERRISPWVVENNVYIEDLWNSPVPGGAEHVYLLKDVFTTINGSWEVTDERWSVPQWARETYLKPFGADDYFDDAGADRHLFAAVIGLDGELLRLKEVIYWSDGFENVNNPEYDGYVFRETKEKSGWINIPIGPGSSYVPERGESGPWCWMPTGGSETICGGGLPSNHHVSTFAVWQKVKLTLAPPLPVYDQAIYLPIAYGAAR
jgi:hypothetical protein